MELLWAAAGAVIGLLLTLFLQPVIEERATSILMRVLGSASSRGKKSLAGLWDHRWLIDSSKYPPAVEQRNCIIR